MQLVSSSDTTLTRFHPHHRGDSPTLAVGAREFRELCELVLLLWSGMGMVLSGHIHRVKSEDRDGCEYGSSSGTTIVRVPKKAVADAGNT